ncbi:MAG: MMPL family transporter, partial [Candidatus Heimdallarchaeota archaeon]
MGYQSQGRFKLNKFVLTILIWAIIIIATSSGGSRLTNDVDSEAQFIDPTTEAGKGFEIVEDRFQQVDNVVHIVVLDFAKDSSQELSNPQWQFYSLALATMIVQEFTAIDDDGRGYKQVFSQSLLLNQAAKFNLSDPEQAIQAGLLQGFAAGLISQDNKSAIINLFTDEYDFEKEQSLLEEHVLYLRSIVSDKESVFEFATSQLNISLAALPSDAEYDELNIYVTGQVANFVDLIEVSESTFRSSEIIAVVLIILILTIVFRSPLGVVIPIIAMIASLFPTYMITYLLAKGKVFPVSDFLPSIIAMIGIAVAVDYNLFSMIRYREEYRKRRAKLELDNNWNKITMIETQVTSAKIMNQTAGQAVMYSGFTVIIGFISFIVLDSEFTTGMAIGVSIVVLFSIFSARTLTPAILSIWGRFLDWPNFMSRANQDVERQKSTEHKDNELKGPWMRWSKLVMRRPIEFIVLGLIILAPFIILSAQTNLSFDSLQNLPEGTESREGFEVIVDKFNLGQTTPYLIVFDLGETTNIFDANFNADMIFDQIALLGAWALQDNVKFEGINSLSIQTIAGN